MRIHLISIGGAVMHNLAMALQREGHQVSGSDDAIFDPALTRLKNAGLLPATMGWDAANITPELDVVILGMHARADNPELAKAKELGLSIYSFPEYVLERSRNKKRIVIGGSHGKTSTTAMLMHAFRENGLDFDFLVGSQLEGFDLMVQFSDASRIVIEGDEYLNSVLDPRPKFHIYEAQQAILTGIAWDHVNVFPTFENYIDQFRIFLQGLPEAAPVAYFEGDEHLRKLAAEVKGPAYYPYQTPEYTISDDGFFYVNFEGIAYPLQVFGEHNLQNMEAARIIASFNGLSADSFWKAMGSFKGTARRLEKVAETGKRVVFRDFAHSPSKLSATLQAVRQRYPKHRLVACFELHTFSSLSENFLKEYEHTMDGADLAIVYYNSHVFELKRMKMLEASYVAESFGPGVVVVNNNEDLQQILQKETAEATVFLMMSSGNFDNLDFKGLV